MSTQYPSRTRSPWGTARPSRPPLNALFLLRRLELFSRRATLVAPDNTVLFETDEESGPVPPPAPWQSPNTQRSSSVSPREGGTTVGQEGQPVVRGDQ